jgi:hypothetical protein
VTRLIHVVNLSKTLQHQTNRPGTPGSFAPLVQPQYQNISAVADIPFEV